MKTFGKNRANKRNMLDKITSEVSQRRRRSS